MDIISVILFAVFWVSCGVLSYGFNFAFYQRRFFRIAKDNYRKDQFHCFFASIFGQVSLVVLMIKGQHEYGIKFR